MDEKRKLIAIWEKDSELGSVLLSVLLIALLFSFVLLQTLTTYKRQAQIFISTKDYYVTETLENIALSLLEAEENQQNAETKKGSLTFNLGQVDYEKKAEGYVFSTKLNGKADIQKRKE